MRRFDVAVVEQIREEGWALVPGALTADELEAARAEAALALPSADEYHELTASLPPLQPSDDPIEAYHITHHGGRSAAWQRHRIGVDMPCLFGLATSPAPLELATRLFDDTPVVAECTLSAKYARGADLFEQGFHIDPLYAVYPRRTTPSFRMWVYLTDVTTDHGPTEVLPFGAHEAHGDDLARFAAPTADFSGYYYQDDHPDLAGRVRRAEAEAGSALIYQARTHHRATGFAETSGCRWIAAYSYRAASRTWMATSWDLTRVPGGRIRPDFAGLDVGQRTALGFPPPGDPYWDEEAALHEVARLFPGLDLTPYRRPSAA